MVAFLLARMHTELRTVLIKKGWVYSCRKTKRLRGKKPDGETVDDLKTKKKLQQILIAFSEKVIQNCYKIFCVSTKK